MIVALLVLQAVGAANQPSAATDSGRSARTTQPADTTARVAFGAFVDAYYAWDVSEPPTRDRSLAPAPTLAVQFDVVNGWQNISENNSGKGVGLRLDYAVTPNVAVSYYNLFSDEAGNRLRSFNGVGAKATGTLPLLGELDVGSQRLSATDGGTATWFGFAIVVRAQVASRVAISGRLERFDDEDQNDVFPDGDSGVPRKSAGFIVTSLGLTL